MRRRDFVARGTRMGAALWTLMQVPRPAALVAARRSSVRLTFSQSEWELAEAITGRIIPTDHEPGAIEAGCVNFIDKALAYEDRAYRSAYFEGLLSVDRAAEERFGGPFVSLDPNKQDEILLAVEAGEVPGWTSSAVAPADFFETIRGHTIIGFLANPSHGGNRDYVGWKVIGFPGPRHEAGGYTPEQMIGAQPIEAIWGEPLD